MDVRELQKMLIGKKMEEFGREKKPKEWDKNESLKNMPRE